MMMRMMMVRRMRVVNFCKLTTSPHETCALECNREREILSLKKRLHAVCHATTRTRAYEHGTFQSKVMSLSVWRHGYDARTDHLWIRVASVQKLSRKTFSLAWWLMIHRENAIGKMFLSLSLHINHPLSRSSLFYTLFHASASLLCETCRAQKKSEVLVFVLCS